MHTMIYGGEKLNIEKRYHEGLEIFQIEWPDYSLDFLYREVTKDKKESWQCMTNLPRKHITEIGLYIQKTYKLN